MRSGSGAFVWAGIIAASVLLPAAHAADVERKTVICGLVATANGAPIGGVRIESSANTSAYFSDAKGRYEFQVPDGMDEITLTPSKEGYLFSPSQSTIMVSSGDDLANFMGTNTAGTVSRDAAVQRVATPTFNLPLGRYWATASVSVACATTGATIRYTTDGSDPSSDSSTYTAPLVLTKKTVLKAKAFLAGLPDSGIMNVRYMVTPRAAMPVLSPSTGTSYGSVQVKITCATAGATIRYTTDGSVPSVASTAYSSPITFTANTILKAGAFKDGVANSHVVKAIYTVQPQVATPTVSPAAGTSYASVGVSLACATAGATVRYTTDGSEPAAGSTAYSTALTFTQTTTLKAKAFKAGLQDSGVWQAQYTVLPQVASPAFGSVPGTYYGLLNLKITCATSGASIYYTTDGGEPTASSALYSAPITISAKTAVKAKAFKNGLTESVTLGGTFNILPEVAAPAIAPLTTWYYGGSVKAAITCATPGATIRYTTDGSEPTAVSAIYTGALMFTQTTQLKAKAFKSGLKDSDETDVNYKFIE